MAAAAGKFDDMKPFVSLNAKNVAKELRGGASKQRQQELRKAMAQVQLVGQAKNNSDGSKRVTLRNSLNQYLTFKTRRSGGKHQVVDLTIIEAPKKRNTRRNR